MAYQRELPMDDQPVSGCLSEFEALMSDGTGRPRWEWFENMFRQLPEPEHQDVCTVTFSWFTSTFETLPNNAREDLVVRHARAYIMMLLSNALFADKTAVRVHLRWSRYLPTSDENLPRVVAYKRKLDKLTHREVNAVDAVVHSLIWHEDHRALWTSIVPLSYFGCTEWHQVDRVIPQYGGVQNISHRPLNIDFLHAKDGRGIDRYDSSPSIDFLRWWFLVGKRYLAAGDAFYQRSPDEIPIDATQRESAPHSQRSQVPNIPDNM
ncbi:hypothetical protein PIB30_026707 [Stylosanthes scabra]|uniref:Aminotransferase-like plant mobile domain-containing protein n=1 Tax=Stylosanthes scabra TaxID=79078 RepID=A0ABU6SA94_9FABA|nr:hypothetical protein [Stylosanthes scabra]